MRGIGEIDKNKEEVSEKLTVKRKKEVCTCIAVADAGGQRGHGHPSPVKISHNKDGCIDFMLLGPLYPAVGSATVSKEM